jgi:hypothetical protein
LCKTQDHHELSESALWAASKVDGAISEHHQLCGVASNTTLGRLTVYSLHEVSL